MLLQHIASRMNELQVHQRHWSHKHIHSLTLQQETTIMTHLTRSPAFDPYAAVATLCPEQADLRNISNDEVVTRLNSLNNLSSEQRFSRVNASPEEEEACERQEGEVKMDSFCNFSQPSVRNFFDEVEESSSMSLWNQLQQ